MVRYSKEDVLNEHERMQLINACKNDKERFVIQVLLYTGMRAGEFCAMKQSWIDWQKEVIHIPRFDGDWKPKTSSGAREIPLMFEAKRKLYDFFQKKNEIGMNRVTVFRIVRRVGNRLKPFKKVYPHALRATFASMMAERSMNPADIQSIMGWAKLETANNYVRSTMALKNFKDRMGGAK